MFGVSQCLVNLFVLTNIKYNAKRDKQTKEFKLKETKRRLNSIRCETKEIILEKIKNAQTIKGRNSMGISKSFYNPYFLIKQFKEIKELDQLTEKELNLLLEFANYATNVFY